MSKDGDNKVIMVAGTKSLGRLCSHQTLMHWSSLSLITGVTPVSRIGQRLDNRILNAGVVSHGVLDTSLTYVFPKYIYQCLPVHC